MDLKTYCLGRPSGQRILAEQIGVCVVLISQWANKRRSVPAARAVAIEIATGGEVTRRDLRPDDWEKLWPELSSQAAEGVRHAA